MPYQVAWERLNVFKDGEPQTLQRGEYVPSDVDDVQVSNLHTVGAVRFVDLALPPLPSNPLEFAAAPLPEPVDSLGRPAPTAAKAEWVEYAVAHGLSDDEANTLTRNDLVARFAPASPV